MEVKVYSVKMSDKGVHLTLVVMESLEGVSLNLKTEVRPTSQLQPLKISQIMDDSKEAFRFLND